MNDTLVTALKDLRTSIEESGALITQDELPTVLADRSQLVILLENLIGNAIKFRGHEAPQIRIYTEHLERTGSSPSKTTALASSLSINSVSSRCSKDSIREKSTKELE